MIRIEILSRNEFWRSAVLVEWEHQYPGRKLKEVGNGYVIDPDWLEDLTSVAGECFSEIVLAPPNPSRRLLFRHFVRLNKTEIN